MSIVIDEAYLVDITQKMVQIDSRNPDMVNDNPQGEAKLGQYVAGLMEAIGLEVHVHELAEGRVNVVGILRGKGQGKSLLLNAHLDTIGVEGMVEPFSGRVTDNKLYGRGSQDMKGSLAAMITAAKAIVDAGIELDGDLLVTAVADEEWLSIGMDDLVKHYTADAAVVTEPTDLVLTRAHRGFAWYEVVVSGRAAHGSRYDEGINAIMLMGRFLAELDKLEQELRQRPHHPLTKVPSLHTGLIEGGTAPSVYAASCKLNIERRLNPGETEAQARQEIQAILDRLAEADLTFKAELTMTFTRSPFEVAGSAPIVQVVEQALVRRMGEAKPHVGATFWTDAAILDDAGIDTVLLGPVGAGLHSDEEWVDVKSLVDLAHVLAETAVRWCGV